MVSNQIRPPGFPPIQNNQNRFYQNRGSNFNQGQVYPTPINQPPVYQSPAQQMQGVSKTDFENYVKANDAVLRNMQNQGQGLQNQITNLTEMLSKFISSNTASSSNSGTLPSQTVTNPREHGGTCPLSPPMAITTRSGKTCEGPSTPLVPTPVVSTPQKEPEQNPERSMDKVQKPSSESTAQVPPPEDHDSIFIRIKPRLWNKLLMEPNSPYPNSYQPKLPYPERMKQLGLGALKPTRMTLELANRFLTHPMGIAEDVVVRVDGFNFLADFVMVNFEPDPRVPIILGRPFLRTAKALIDLYEEKLTLRVENNELVFYAEKSEKGKNKQFAHAISVIDFSKDEPFNGSTTTHSDALPPSSSPVKTNDNPEELTDELTLLKKDVHEENFQVYLNPLFEFDDNFNSSNVNPLFNEMVDDVENENYNILNSDEPVLLNTPLSDPLHHEFAGELLTLPSRNVREHEEYLSLMTLLFQEEIDIFLVPDNLIPPGVENDDSEDEDNSTFLPENESSILEPSSPRPPPEPPDVCLNFKPDTAMKFVYNQGENVLSLNVEDVNSFTFFIWTFLPYLTYPEDSPFILSLRSEDLVFDPGISTFHFSLKPVPFALPKDE
ncbi:reverse transcriptase domain-containing protein [Tanacetum coccineum]